MQICVSALERGINGVLIGPFRFIHAPHGRDALRITYNMLLRLLSYLQVMPSFLDFLFTYGIRQYAQDLHLVGFRSDSRLKEVDRGLVVNELGRSGREIRMCYCLKGVEPSNSEPEWGWSIRQTVVYHSLDA